ncbi:MAG TPA: group I intron-associated PD-(D/E)XK endonuclease [Pyrinomonadaceae bacterium]|nr:group I intron-associated PD-(D/E)XK endonuclease [Pyrinomonadaceae bacterium]
MSTMDVGNISEALVMAAYANAGFWVSVPFGSGCAYDLVVDTGSRLFKVQVKTGWLRKGCLIFKGQRRVRDSRCNGMRRYREGEVDFFAAYFPPTGSIYVVPFGLVGTHGCLRLTPVLNGQQKLIRWAADFTWEKHLEQLRLDEGVEPAPAAEL